MASKSLSLTFANWPSTSVTPPDAWVGLQSRHDEASALPASVLKQIASVVRAFEGSGVQALWLSGSAVRGQLRHASDIDWVVLTESPAPADDWPTSRHSFQTYEPAAFLRLLSEGHEFAVWQLAYGHLLLGNLFLDQLRATRVASNTTAASRKRRVIARRRRLIRLLASSGAISEVRQEILLLLQQQLRVELIEAGYVPGCRAELEDQLAIADHDRYLRWRDTNAEWIDVVRASQSDARILAAAQHYGQLAA
jgi:hypothetical protein